MRFWVDLISGRRYPSAYEPLRYLPAHEFVEFGDDDDEAMPGERPSDGQEYPGSAA